jgi:carboxyl-terminal processing protease
MRVFLSAFLRKISIAFALFLSIASYAQNTADQNAIACSKKMDALWVLLQKKHIAPIQFNTEVSQQIVELLLMELDYRKIHFYESDKQALNTQIQNIKPSSSKDLCKLVSSIADLYQTRVKESQTILETLAKSELNFNENEIVTFSYVPKPFMESKEKKVNRWTRNIKYLVLTASYYSLDSLQIKNATAPKDFLINKNKSTSIIINKELKKINSILSPTTDFYATVEDALLNAVCKRYDPHTEYYDYNTYKQYSEQLQSQVLTFGIFLSETDYGSLSVDYIAPGSMAWFLNVVQVGDVVTIIKLNQQVYDITSLTYQEANDLLQNEKHTVLELTVKKENGTTETIKLKKEAIKFENNTVKSYIVKSDKKIGYISIPSFYSDSNNPSALGCANELSKEILKLKNENIEGLIIDLRYNGGGSLDEAIGMSSLFIDIGPLFYVLDNTGKATLTKDMHRGTVYDGPLCIMVNGYSASASEIFSAAMQDNNRALIIGEQTYGKATGQGFHPLDTTVSRNKFSATDNMGIAKLTQIKLYRTTGISYQGKGVTPDIILPYVNLISNKENKEAYYLKGDSISKKAVFTFPAPLPIATLNEKNTIRMSENSKYKYIKQVSDSLRKTQYDDFIMHLTVAGFWNDMKILDKESEKEDRASTYTRTGFEVYYNQLEADFLMYDANYKKLYTSYLDELKTDLILQQTYDIMCDFIKLNQK